MMMNVIKTCFHNLEFKIFSVQASRERTGIGMCYLLEF